LGLCSAQPKTEHEPAYNPGSRLRERLLVQHDAFEEGPVQPFMTSGFVTRIGVPSRNATAFSTLCA
jgi:hypothetical protein